MLTEIIAVYLCTNIFLIILKTHFLFELCFMYLAIEKCVNKICKIMFISESDSTFV